MSGVMDFNIFNNKLMNDRLAIKQLSKLLVSLDFDISFTNNC